MYCDDVCMDICAEFAWFVLIYYIATPTKPIHIIMQPIIFFKLSFSLKNITEHNTLRSITPELSMV